MAQQPAVVWFNRMLCMADLWCDGCRFSPSVTTAPSSSKHTPTAGASSEIATWYACNLPHLRTLNLLGPICVLLTASWWLRCMKNTQLRSPLFCCPQDTLACLACDCCCQPYSGSFHAAPCCLSHGREFSHGALPMSTLLLLDGVNSCCCHAVMSAVYS